MDAQVKSFKPNPNTDFNVSNVARQSMSKVIIVGHPDSGYQDVESTLLDSGMQSALPSLKEGLSAQLVAEQICSVHGRSINDTATWPEIEQLNVSPIWYALVLDLIRGNIKQSFWGWADPNAIFLLDFWKSVSPDATFLLVYNHPQTAILGRQHDTTESIEGKKNTPSAEQSIQNWMAYNKALLHFFQSNKERCLLVHADFIDKNAGKIFSLRNGAFSQLSEETDVQLGKTLAANDMQIKGSNGTQSIADPLRAIRFSRFAKDRSLENTKKRDTADNPAEQYLANSILELFPDAYDLYEELQAIATIESPPRKTTEIDANVAWDALQNILATNSKLIREQAVIQHQFETLENEFERAARHRQIEKAQESQTEQNLTRENKLLVRQLHSVQEQLEKYYIENRSQKSLLSEQINEKSLTDSKNQELHFEMQQLESSNQKLYQEIKLRDEQIEFSIEQIKFRDEQIRLSDDQIKLRDEQIKFSVEQIKSRDEQIKFSVEQIKSRDEQIKLLSENQMPVFTGAKERQQNELVYRVGYALVQLSRSFVKWKLLLYPLFIHKFLKTYACEEQQTDRWLPPLTEYQDYDEAIKAQRHLSYQLGVAWQKHCRGFGSYFAMHWALLGIYRRWRREKTKNLPSSFKPEL